MEPSAKSQLEEQKLQQEILKLEKETEKVDLELSELRKPHWKRPTTIAAFLPTIAAIISLIIFASNGFFSVESTRMENQRFAAQKDLDSLYRVKLSLIKDSRVLRNRIDSAAADAKTTIERLREEAIQNR